MRTVLSYPIELLPPASEPWATAEILMPIYSRVLRVGFQGETPTMWVIANPDNPRVMRTFVAVSSGDQIPSWASTSTYIGGWVDLGMESYSWELFEVRG